MRRSVAWQMDLRFRPSMGKRLSQVVLAHEGGQELVGCQDISCGESPVVAIVGVVVVGFGSITVGCEFEV